MEIVATTLPTTRKNVDGTEVTVLYMVIPTALELIHGGLEMKNVKTTLPTTPKNVDGTQETVYNILTHLEINICMSKYS